MTRPFPCWLVDVRAERNSGALGHIRSKPLTLTQARKLLATYEATGTPARIVCLEELVTLEKAMKRGKLGRAEAVLTAREMGYDVQ